MARIKETIVKKKKTRITFEFEHKGKIHEAVSTLGSADYELMSVRTLKNHIRARAKFERMKLDEKSNSGSGKKTKKEKQGKKSEVSEIAESSTVEKGLGQQPDLEEESTK